MSDSSAGFNRALNHCPACLKNLPEESLTLLGDVPCPHCGQFLWFVQKSAGDAVILTFLPGLVCGSDPVLRVGEIMAASGNAPRLILNLSHLRLISSMFLAMLLVIYRRMLAVERTLKLCGLEGDNLEVFRITKLDWLFEICADEKQALLNP
jgi:anti-anti-sigma regulatory factor